jgi:hypothetical protein
MRARIYQNFPAGVYINKGKYRKHTKNSQFLIKDMAAQLAKKVSRDEAKDCEGNRGLRG